MKKTMLCQGCWEQMHVPIPIRGPLSIPFRLFGIKQTRMHPNMCTVCELMFTRVKKSKQIPIATTILFADLRGFTSFSREVDPSSLNALLQCYYDHCSHSVWEYDGIVNKFIGDAVLAIFNFPLERNDHAKRAVSAGLELQRRCKDLKSQVQLDAVMEIGVGVGIHTGTASIGEIGTSYKEFTAIGPVVNLASRVQSSAKSGEIVLTESVYSFVKSDYPAAEKRLLTLKGIDEPVEAYVITS
jgi:adenylate cyclase